MYKSEFPTIMDRFFQNLFMTSHFLLNEPSVFPLSMQGLVQPFRKPSGMVSPIQKVIYVGRFVCPRKQIIHIPHAYHCLEGKSYHLDNMLSPPALFGYRS
jgi:hypothetical protein